MGSRYTAVFLAESEFDEAAIAASLFDAVDGVDRQMSNWKPDSDLCRLNRSPVDQWIDVPRALADVLACALRVSRDSDGAFDIGLGELIDAWGFGAAGTRVDERRIRAVQAQAYRPAAELMDVDPVRSRVRKRAAITLNLSGIAKGYGVDCLARCLDGHGVAHYLVGIDGEMRARGVKPSGGGWTIAIEKPLRGVREVMSVMELSDAAIATSGDYRHCTEYKGRRYAHTMNGAVLEPSQNRLASVSVVAPTCMAADAWATALLVLGETQGVKLAQERGMDALFVLREGDGFRQVPVFPSMQ
jgi:thiamine biosynthesis lipoprotein